MHEYLENTKTPSFPIMQNDPISHATHVSCLMSSIVSNTQPGISMELLEQSLIQAPCLDEPIDLFPCELFDVLLITLVERDDLLSYIHHRSNINVALS